MGNLDEDGWVIAVVAPTVQGALQHPKHCPRCSRVQVRMYLILARSWMGTNPVSQSHGMQQGWGLEQPALVEDVPAYGKGLGHDEL